VTRVMCERASLRGVLPCRRSWFREAVKDHSDLLTEGRRSRLVLVNNLFTAPEAEIAENERQRSIAAVYSEFSDRLQAVAHSLAADLQWARAFIKESMGEDLEALRAREANMVEVFGPSDEAIEG
jgi:hypothetical protein